MKHSKLAAASAAFIVAAMAAAPVAQAQTRPIKAWTPPQQGELDPAKRLPAQAPVQEARRDASAPVDASNPSAAANPAAAQPGGQVHQAPAPYAAERTASPPARYETGRGGFFLGVKGGKGEVYEDVRQSAREINAGYRWQAGPVALVGIEVAGGKLDATTDDGWRYADIDYGSIGVNARFNFGRNSPVFGLVRAGYWAAEEDDYGMDVDGGYFGLGLGVDFGRHANVSLTYTNYVYFDGYYWDDYYEINRADTLMLGAEVRF